MLGVVTGDLKFVVHDAYDGTTPVDIDLDALLGKIPQKTFEDNRKPYVGKPLELPADLTVKDALD